MEEGGWDFETEGVSGSGGPRETPSAFIEVDNKATSFDPANQDAIVFETIVKSAVFDVLQTPPEEDVNLETREDLLLDFLSAFEGLTQQRGLIQQILERLHQYYSQQ